MRFIVLGAIQVIEGNNSYLPTAPKERQLMGLLLMSANQVVPMATCLAELWSEAPPRSARTVLQTYVMHLRNALARVPSIGRDGGRLVTREPGYLLRVESGQLDVDQFRHEVALGRVALARGDDLATSRHFRAGLALWQGTALSDVPSGPVLGAQVTRLEQVRMAVLEQCVAADLRLGRHRELLSELTGLVRRYPVNETLHAQYMLTLYRCGRQVDALDTYRVLARRLRADLNVEVSDMVRETQRAILSPDPTSSSPPLRESMRALWPERPPSVV